ncbi:hypothetical protein BH23CHL5_BH23CHL5_18820 [soil metagenome]
MASGSHASIAAPATNLDGGDWLPASGYEPQSSGVGFQDVMMFKFREQRDGFRIEWHLAN